MQEFYDSKASRGFSAERNRTIAALIEAFLAPGKPDILSVLDVGCGGGETTLAVFDILEKRGVVEREKVSLYGWEVSPVYTRKALDVGIQAEVRDVSHPDAAATEKHPHDLVIFSEVLEHLVDTGCAMRNIRRVLKTGGALVLTTPNLAAWYNRILLLMGIQPHLTEVSFESRRFGNPLFAKVMVEIPGSARMAGHLRVFTYKALIEFLQHFDFEIIRCLGIASHGDLPSRFISKIWTAGAGGIGVLAIKRPERQSDLSVGA